MTTNLNVGDLSEIRARGRFLDVELPNQDKELIKLSMPYLTIAAFCGCVAKSTGSASRGGTRNQTIISIA